MPTAATHASAERSHPPVLAGENPCKSGELVYFAGIVGCRGMWMVASL